MDIEDTASVLTGYLALGFGFVVCLFLSDWKNDAVWWPYFGGMLVGHGLGVIQATYWAKNKKPL
jgi:hypothetical protein